MRSRLVRRGVLAVIIGGSRIAICDLWFPATGSWPIEQYCFDILDGMSKDALAMAEQYERELGIEGGDDAA